MPQMSDWDDLAVRVGTVVRAAPNEGAKDPAYSLWIDFGHLGEMQSSAMISDLYDPPQLVGRQVVAVTGFESTRVGGFRSDVLVLGALTDDGIVLLELERPVMPGSIVA